MIECIRGLLFYNGTLSVETVDLSNCNKGVQKNSEEQYTTFLEECSGRILQRVSVNVKRKLEYVLVCRRKYYQ